MTVAPTTLALALAPTFQEALTALEASQVKDVLEAISRLQKGHGGSHLHALQGLPWVSFNVSKNALRIIAHREDDALLLVWVDKHDVAYEWARRRVPRRFGHVVRLQRVLVDDEVAPSIPTTTTTTTTSPPGPLSRVRAKDFRHIDVDANLGEYLRGVPDDDVLLALCGRLDDPLAEALVALATDPDDLQGIVARYGQAKDGATTTLAEALRAPVNGEQAWVLPPDTAALKAALDGDAASWRVFLHPSQKRLVTRKRGGAVLVTGGPGTGKSVVALHRARHLLETSTDARPVLLTTFSRVLVRHLDESMRALCVDAPTLLPRVRPLTLTAAARAVLDAADEPSALLVDEDLDAAWAEALKLDTAERGRSFYEAERADVVIAHGVVDEAGYLKAPRAGRGGRLDAGAKRAIWQVLSAYDEALRQRGGDDANGLARRATTLLRSGVVTTPYAAVVCDEVQDASLAELTLLKALAGDEELFLVGDGHQRLYKKPVSLRAAGIEVRGRSVRLRLNYRTTQGICSAAVALVDDLDKDILEDEAEVDDGGYRSVRAGPGPERHRCTSSDEEADVLAATIASAMASTPKQLPVLVLARTRATLERLQQQLRDRGTTAPILGDTDSVGDAHVVLASMHRAKGLEAPTVVLAAQHEVPLAHKPGRGDGVVDKETWLRRERLLQYVGMTRARDRCVITSVG